jgi:deaminated glutathione amidase
MINSNFKVACVQLSTGTDITTNLPPVLELIRSAKDNGADLIITPEQTLLMANSKKQLFNQISYEEEDKSIAVFCDLALELKVFLIIGSLSIKIDDYRAVNRSYIINNNGKIIGHYDKIHMFDVQLESGETYHESSTFESGKKISIIDVPWGKIGLTICYDLRFPGLYKSIATRGARFITVPSAFTKYTGSAHWHVLLRARAIETGCFIFAPAQVGKHQNGRETYGHSLIVSPWGEILAEAMNDNPCFIIADINTEEVMNSRNKIPAWSYGCDYDDL